MPANDLDNEDDPPMHPKADMVLATPVVSPPKLPPAKPPVNNVVTPSAPEPNTPPPSQVFQQMMMNQAANPQQEDHWVKSYWRPAAAWLYMLICLVDFVIFPALTMVLPAILKGFGVAIAYIPWQSLSLQNGGLIHLSFAAILGVAAWTRGNEKIAKVNYPRPMVDKRQ
jgi:hypothetical protein